MERLQVEEELKESEERYRDLLETSSEFLLTLDLKGNFTNVNQSAVKLTGYTKAELLKMNFIDYTPTNIKRKLLVAIHNVFKTGKYLKDFPVEAIIKDKTVKFFETTISTIKKDEKIIGFQGSSKDITERKQAELTLQKSEAKFRAIAQTASDAIISVDSSGKIMLWNHSAEQIFGYSEQEISGKPLTLLMPERFQEAHKKGFSRVNSGGDLKIIGKTIEAVGISKDGQEFPMELSLAKWEIGDELYFSAIIRDITERKQAEKELTKLYTAVAQSPSVIAITDSDGKLEFVNPKFTEITGYNREEAIGQNPRILKSGEHPAEKYKALWETISSGKTWRGEMHNKKKSGELFWEMVSISPIFDEQGELVNYIKVAEDITERKQAEEELNKHREHLEELVNERTAELEEKNNELERYNRLFEGREFRIKELRDQVKELKARLGE